MLRTFRSRRGARIHAGRVARHNHWVRLPWTWHCPACAGWHVTEDRPEGRHAVQWPAWAERYPLVACAVCGAPTRLTRHCPACAAVVSDVQPDRLQARLRAALTAADRHEVDHLLALLRATRCRR